ncbi:DNRLRE domain-containing protein [Streptomyces sp. RK9]|uniref:DNRLRE domain-containing protein n=1 Tax=Streptomyces sp. RK9 TaxID=3239284 RepID=UPI0038660C6A
MRHPQSARTSRGRTSSRISLRTAAASGLSALTALALIGPATPALAESSETPSSPAAQTHADASGTITEANTPEAAITAAQVGQRKVEVLERRTETSTTWANPDGTLTTTLSAGPIRMVRDGKWVDVDATLAHQPDGSVAAKAHPQDLRLAGAGGVKARSITAAAEAPDSKARDLISLGMGDQRMAVQWKGGLPKPVIEDHQAVYPQAVPGADLVVDATRTGFEQFLVLKERPKDSKAPWTVPLTLPGINATQHEDGSVSFKDKKTGDELATMPAPVMWDSQTDERSGERTNSTQVDMKLSQDGDTVELTLTPDSRFLGDPDTKYPVTIDPATDGLSTLFDTFVQQGDTTDQSASTDLKLGWPGDWADTAKKQKRIARSYMTWDTSIFANALVDKAELSLYNYHSWSCEKREWEVWAAGAADTKTRWTNQPALTEKVATSTQTRGKCNDAGWVNADITALAKTWSSANAEEGHIGLKAADESDTYAWKRFYSSESTADQIPQLTVDYNYRPRNGANLQAGPPYVAEGGIYKVNTLTPTLRFTPQDANENDMVRGTYQITDKETGKVVSTVIADPVATGETSQVVVPEGKLANSKTYTFRTTTDDGTHWSPGWSEPVTFTVDTKWKLTPELKALGAVNSALDAADVTAATTSDSTHAAIATSEGNTVRLPRSGEDAISVKSDGRGDLGITLPTAQPRGVNVNGNVVYHNPDSPVDTVAQPSTEGAASIFQVIKNAKAPREYTTSLKLPAGASLSTLENNRILISSGTGDDTVTHGVIEAPWATDANGNAVPTAYRIEGSKLVQTVDFDSKTAFPVVADPKISFGWGVYLAARGMEWKVWSSTIVTAGYIGSLYTCTVAKLPAKIAGIAKMVCGAASLNGLKNLLKVLKQIKKKKLDSKGCYQTKILPSNGKLSKVSKKKC